MTDVNYFSPEQKEEKTETPKSNYGGGLIIAGVVALAAWLFLRNRNTTSETPGGSGYSESISGGGSVPEVPPSDPPFKLPETYFIRDAFTNWWNGLVSGFGGVPTPTNTNDAMLTKLADSRVSTDTEGNAAETLSAVMKKNPEAVTTVKLPFVAGRRTSIQDTAAIQAAAVANERVNPTKSAGIASVANPGTVVNADGTKVNINSYDYFSTVTGKKYETPKNGFGYVSGPGITAVAGNIQAGIKHLENSALKAISTANRKAVVSKNPGSAVAAKEKATKTASQGGTAYNALSAAMAKRRH